MGRAAVVGVALYVAAAAAAAPSGPLAPKWQPAPVGSVTPKGWLLKQLVLQADGLAGHLIEFWGNVKDSSWFGGSTDTGDTSWGPYWLNGLVPLSFLLQNAGVQKLPGDGVGVSAVNLTAQVEQYVNYVIDNQKPSGWLGADLMQGDGGMYVAPAPVLMALMQYAEGMDDGTRTTRAWTRATKAILRHLQEQRRRMVNTPPTSWAQARWEDVALVCQWLLDFAPQGEEAMLMELQRELRMTGLQWEDFFDNVKSDAGFFDHNVNLAQALKTAAVSQRFMPDNLWKNKSWEFLSLDRMAQLDAKCGVPTGMFLGDEYMPNPQTRHPSHGIELCGVVESMYSYNVMYSVHARTEFADREELIAFNALPATWASPRGGDMWAHQYIQAVNQVNAINADPKLWETDGPLAETYGLEPNFPCCTANYGQGWPKFASNLFFTTPAGELVVGVLAPAAVTFPSGHRIDVDTEYPFDDTIIITVTPKPGTTDVTVLIRVPGWADKATVDNQPVANGTHYKQVVSTTGGQTCTVMTLKLNPEIRVKEWDRGAVSVHHGALMYSLPIAANYTVYGTHYGGQANDYYLEPRGAWNYALDVDLANPGASLTFARSGVDPVAGAPFNHTGWATTVTARVRPVGAWTIEKNSAGLPPLSPACAAAGSCGAPVKVTLVPHGGTELRIGEFPRSGL